MFTAACSVLNNAAILQPPRAFQSHSTYLSTPFTTTLIVVHNSANVVVVWTVLYSGYKHLPGHDSKIADQLPARFYEHTARITRRACGEKDGCEVAALFRTLLATTTTATLVLAGGCPRSHRAQSNPRLRRAPLPPLLTPVSFPSSVPLKLIIPAEC